MLTARELDLHIYAVVRQIPRGRVATYGWIAARAGLPRGARRVGLALRRLDSGRRVPWHRVLNAQGRVSLPAGSRSATQQRERLLAEGILSRNGRVDLRRYGWRQSLDELLWGFPDPTPTAAP